MANYFNVPQSCIKLGQKWNSGLTSKIMDGIHNSNIQDRECHCNKLSKREDGKRMYNDIFGKSMVVYKLKYLITGKLYIGKNQRTFKTRTKEHINDIWKLISSGMNKFGSGWYGSRG